MNPSFQHRLVNLLQSALLIAGMALIAWVCVSAVAGPGTTAIVVLGTVLGLLAAPAIPKRMLLSAYGARRLSGGEFPEAVAMLAELARRANLPRTPALYYIPSRLPNAFSMGTPEDGVVCVSDGLLRLLDRRELAGVLAHEVAHIANLDLWIMGVADAMARAVSAASWLGQAILLINLPLLMAGAAHVPWQVPLLLMFSPTLMALLQLALSRTREFDADRGAVELTGDAEGLASALLKMDRDVGRMWEEMFLPGRRIPEPSLLRTHPPTEERVRRLRALSGVAGRPDLGRWDDRAPPTFAPPDEPGFGPFGVYR